jgi:hypothetical protein
MILLLTALFLSMLATVCTVAVDNCSPVQAAVIWYRSSIGLSDQELRINEHVDRFIVKDLFGGLNLSHGDQIVVEKFPPVFTPSCEGSQAQANQFDKGRGSNIAHKEIWDNFVRRHRNCGERQGDHHHLVVFEYDAFPGFSDSGRRVYDSLQRMKSDFHHLGYCYRRPDYHPSIRHEAPYCLYAYALSLRGGRNGQLRTICRCAGRAGL